MKSGLFGEEWWKENLRMKKTTFDYLCNQLRPYISKQTTVFRDPVSIKERLAITLWRLATNVEYRTIASLFGVGRSTVCTVVLDTCRALKTLLPRYVFMPKDDHLRDIIHGFNAVWGFPQTVGAIDGTHIPILRPSGDSGSDYFNQKSFYSIIMQAVVDYRGIFWIYMWDGQEKCMTHVIFQIHPFMLRHSKEHYCQTGQGIFVEWMYHFVFLVTLLIPPFPG